MYAFACAEQGKNCFLQLKSGKAKSRGAGMKNSVLKSCVEFSVSYFCNKKYFSNAFNACLEGLFALQDTT